ncbi:iron chelate uptake ABC transporter family permease subunit [Marinobacter nanhaiticus D15-8W]|uniref:Iron ABC transporter permease n=1 Tax=Marinobacter nanhaiticus D15-8W TaxID=626887 RepID=N6WVX2_9GAMM|nr:iron ABC transporter permease [Marinobacter nanhaiticus]ENO15172.1 iron ABC transporter permease [Marinobacter nanhaiticus D15-8W]BES69127.1 iron chelate uptake ABC transporter family permease subunit [Marinobacter nanhaiticus D15-8W]
MDLSQPKHFNQAAIVAPAGYLRIPLSSSARGWNLLLEKRSLVVNSLLLLLLMAVAVVSLSLGTVKLGPAEVVAALLGEGSQIHQFVIRELRLQRVLAGIATGGAFALSGCLMQTLARNRLATPGIIGIDNAATAFAVASVVGTGLALAPSAMALAGAATATALAFGLAGGSGTQGYRFIIAGLGIGAIAGAVTQVMLSRVAIDAANAAYPWTVGSLNARNPVATAILGAGLAIGMVLALILGRRLRILLFADPVVVGLGINLQRVRFLGLCLSVLLTGLAVAVAGPVGLVALLGPEIARALSRYQGVPLLASALAGAIIMVLADLTGRLMLAPLEIPVGIVTAVIGSPYLLWILLRRSPKSHL